MRAGAFAGIIGLADERGAWSLSTSSLDDEARIFKYEEWTDLDDVTVEIQSAGRHFIATFQQSPPLVDHPPMVVPQDAKRLHAFWALESAIRAETGTGESDS